MGRNKETRLRKVEKAQKPPAEEQQVTVVVDWTPAGEPRPPAAPGEIIITWDDIGEEGSDEGT